MTEGKRESLDEVLSRLGAVREAADRLGIEPIEAARRIAADLSGYDSSKDRAEERGYQIVKRATELAKALT